MLKNNFQRRFKSGFQSVLPVQGAAVTNLCSMKMSSMVSASQMLRGEVSPPETHTNTQIIQHLIFCPTKFCDLVTQSNHSCKTTFACMVLRWSFNRVVSHQGFQLYNNTNHGNYNDNINNDAKWCVTDYNDDDVIMIMQFLQKQKIIIIIQIDNFYIALFSN